MTKHLQLRPASNGRAHFTAALLACLTMVFSLAQAGEGHDHGEAPATAESPAQPRFTAESEDFELVGVLQGQRITMYLDRKASNEPVTQANVELELAGQTLQAKATPDGAFEVALAKPLAEGSVPVSAMVMVGDSSDLLATEIDVHGDEHEQTGSSGNVEPLTMRRWLSWTGATFVVIGLLVFLARQRRLRTGGAA